MKYLIRTKGRRRGAHRFGLPTFRPRARRASGTDWVELIQLGVGDPRAVAR